MQFRTQEELLRHLGKSNDRNLIKRMMERGEVLKKNGMYCYGEDEEKSDLKVISKAMGEKVLNEGEINKLKQENADLKDHLKFFYEMDLARKEAMENVVKAYYDKNPNDGWENAVAKANKFMGFSENPCENDEIEYVKGIIN